MTTLVNLRKKKGLPKQKCSVYIGRGTIFGNRHTYGYCKVCNRLHDRKESIDEYKKEFYNRLTDESFRDSVLSIKGEILGCWCKPLQCHGDIIIEYLNNL